MNPFRAFLNTHWYLLRGRLRFPRGRIGERITMHDGRVFTIFRQVMVQPSVGTPAAPQATFVVRFHVAGMTPRQNIVFSLLPIPFFVGLPGFRAKLWTLDEASGDFQGVYDWDTVTDAEHYARSFAMAFMTRRTEPGSVSSEILTQPDRVRAGAAPR